MTTQQLAAALQRAEAALRRRPAMGLHDDAPAVARWQTGTRVVAQHANGAQIPTDMPQELGGSGDQVTPGWLFRAGLASCAATTIAMAAARAGIELSNLEVRAASRSDTRGLLAMAGADGETVSATPSDLQVQVRIGAPGVEPARQRSLVEASCRCSPVPNAVREAVAVDLRIEVAA